jgi:putative transposase
LYREEVLSHGLSVPAQQVGATAPAQTLCYGNESDLERGFVADALFDGSHLRALTVLDNYTRESLAIEVGQSLKGEDVVNTLNRITTCHYQS